MNTQQSATPFPRPDHKAKKHGKPMKWRRGKVVRACFNAVAAALAEQVQP